MGLKSKLSKMKNFLFDEEEIEKPEKKKVKKKKEETDFIIEKPKEKIESYEDDDFFFDDVSDNEIEKTIEVKSRMTKESETEFKFPEFNDDDFMTPVREEPRFEPVKKVEVKPTLYQGSKRREETKKFKPSPIISPIYGLLDSNGNSLKNDEKKKEEFTVKNREEKNYDIIRKKAYGALDDEFENTISRLSKKTIEEAESDMEEEEKNNQEVYFETDEIKEDKKSTVADKEDDDMVLPTVNFKEIDITENCNDKETKKVSLEDEDDEDTKEQDLFNLIDTIYSGEEK